MHIGLDARLTHYRLGGISTYIRRLIDALARIDPDNTYTVFHSRKSQQRLSDRLQQRPLWTPPHHRLERLALSVELARFRLDVLHSPDFIPPLHGAKHHVITVHDLNFLRVPQQKDGAAQRYYNEQIRWAVRHADHILAVSETTKSDLILLLGTPSDKITVQPHGVDTHFRPLDPPNIEAERKILGLPERYILFVGTLEPRKNIPALLTAFRELHRSQAEMPALVLAGRIGWLFEETAAQITAMQQAGLPIHCRDDIEDHQLPALYNAAEVLVLPAFYEGFGLPVLEAMACGTPVIASNISSLPEVLGDAGLLIDPYQPDTLTAALMRVLTDSTLRVRMRQQGIVRAHDFTWERSAQIALSVYQRVGH